MLYRPSVDTAKYTKSKIVMFVTAVVLLPDHYFLLQDYGLDEIG
jgi:hypothetical protein